MFKWGNQTSGDDFLSAVDTTTDLIVCDVLLTTPQFSTSNRITVDPATSRVFDSAASSAELVIYDY